MRLNSIAENVIVANSNAVYSKISDIARSIHNKTVEIKFSDVKKHIDKDCIFINGKKGDVVVIGTAEQLENYKLDSENGVERMSVRELLRRIDINSIKDETPIKFYVIIG